ncbi:MAG: hypothetical protein ACYTFP_07130 [Planctomycetota bacterium]
MIANLYAVWIGFLAGCISGAVPGLFFYQEDWLGGYPSWRRRMIRLAHISFFGIAFINLAFVLSINLAFVLSGHLFSIESGVRISSYSLIAGAITMPLVCYLSAMKPFFRHLFFIPVVSILIGIVAFLIKVSSL